MIAISRWLLLALGAAFSMFHVVLGLSSLGVPHRPWPTLAALGLYAAATVLSLWPTGRVRMPDWLAAFDLVVAIAVPVLVTTQLDPDADNGFATWYVAAVGTLMTIVAARRQLVMAWIGVGALALQTLLWAGFAALGSLGVVGSIVWVAIAHALTVALASAARAARRYGQAEREAAAWQAAQDAHLFEGRMRLAQTSRIASPMLRRIADQGGVLTEQQRRECRMLEAAIRDEIRGRMLLTDVVRVEVQRARERGITVTLLDEGGIDELDEPARDRVLSRLAEAIARSTADRIIVRTAAEGSPVAVTVVGLRGSGDPAAHDDDDAEVELWLEIPRAVDD
ncbi:hypothetical protein [Agromyces larvae]|uniref:Histidine kinase n=1 Tax=Agromyces larvae TaxID=2929802 RepID=A0ABY4C6Y9_9MICO|nr:hypothetical protein [Agromyces larvae]UOE44470.1 hypothetical protein MTO99_01355 [Agromyces larvae]